MILLIVHHATQVHWSVLVMMSDHGSRNGSCRMNMVVVVVAHDSVMVGTVE